MSQRRVRDGGITRFLKEGTQKYPMAYGICIMNSSKRPVSLNTHIFMALALSTLGLLRSYVVLCTVHSLTPPKIHRRSSYMYLFSVQNGCLTGRHITKFAGISLNQFSHRNDAYSGSNNGTKRRRPAQMFRDSFSQIGSCDDTIQPRSSSSAGRRHAIWRHRNSHQHARQKF